MEKYICYRLKVVDIILEGGRRTQEVTVAGYDTTTQQCHGPGTKSSQKQP